MKLMQRGSSKEVISMALCTVCICGIQLKEGGVIGCDFLFMCDNGDRGTSHAATLKMNRTNT
jgi:hypothetical protein